RMAGVSVELARQYLGHHVRDLILIEPYGHTVTKLHISRPIFLSHHVFVEWPYYHEHVVSSGSQHSNHPLKRVPLQRSVELDPIEMRRALAEFGPRFVPRTFRTAQRIVLESGRYS